MKNRLFVIALIMIIVSCKSENRDQRISQNIDAIENGLIEFTPSSSVDSTQSPATFPLRERLAYHKIPGVSIAVIDDFKIEWAKGYGEGNAENKNPVIIETVFEAASTTKLLVSVIVLHAVEQGLLELDQDVNNYLKSWKIPENDFTRERKVTVHLLLTHQSGLNRPDGGFTWEDGSAPTLVQVLNGEKPAENAPAVVEFAPGAKWQYSNMGYLVLQMLLEDIYDKPLSQIAQEVLFDPLSMRSSTFAYPLPERLRALEALPHDVEGKMCDPVMHPSAIAQGGLMTTPSDLALFAIELMKAYRGYSNKILSREMTQRMFHRELEIDPAVMGFPLGEGLGAILRGEGQNFSFLHPGDNYPGSSCWLEGYPALGKGVVIMTNGVKGNLLALEILPAIARIYRWPPEN